MESTMKRVVLELARTDGFPEGSRERGYVFVAPITEDGHIDADAWKRQRDLCEVRRFWVDEPVRKGLLRHVGRGWRFDYIPGEESDDEPIFKADRHSFSEGSYVTITEQNGEQLPFRVVSVETIRKHDA